MIYHLWNMDTASMVDRFFTADAAFCAVREAAERHGLPYVVAWALELEDDQGAITVIAEGLDLLNRAQQHVST